MRKEQKNLKQLGRIEKEPTTTSGNKIYTIIKMQWMSKSVDTVKKEFRN